MKFDHVVNYNGTYYNAGEDVPMEKAAADNAPPYSDSEIQMETSPHKYSEDELYGMTVKEIKRIAEDNGISISKVLKDDVVKEFLSKQL